MSSFAHGGSSSSSSLYCSAAFALISLGVVCHTRHKKAQAQASERVIEQASKELCEYTGSCHCKRVKFSFTASKHLIIWDCNCSVCFMKKNAHVVVPQSAFKLLSGEDALSLYTFNTHVAKHYFCKYCGVQSYYNPRSNPDGVGITFACINQDQVTTSEVRYFDGDNWEQFITKSGIQKHSKI